MSVSFLARNGTTGRYQQRVSEVTVSSDRSGKQTADGMRQTAEGSGRRAPACGAGDSIKPGVKRSEPQVNWTNTTRSPRSGRQRLRNALLSPAPRARTFFFSRFLGLRFP